MRKVDRTKCIDLCPFQIGESHCVVGFACTNKFKQYINGSKEVVEIVNLTEQVNVQLQDGETELVIKLADKITAKMKEIQYGFTIRSEA